MKRLRLVLIVAINFFPFWLGAKQVSPETAKQVAVTQVSSHSQLRSAQDLNLVFTKTTAATSSQASGAMRASSSAPADVLYYVFNAGSGFVIVSGDDVAKPVLGYSDAGTYDPNNLPPNFVYYLDDFLAKEIEQAIAQGVTQSEETKGQWDAYLSGNITTLRAATAAGPLFGTDGDHANSIAWDQYLPFNHFCPSPTTGSNPIVTGCVATAMAQIMKYYAYPAKGNGEINYTTSTLGLPLSKDLSSDSYNWDNMLPYYTTNTYTGTTKGEDDVATLMYDCGLSVNMDYNTVSAGGSAAFSWNAGKALLTNFGYNQSLAYKQRAYYSDAEWETILKTQIDNAQPVLYSGQGTGGHAFVCDGYDDSGNFHFNWGWSGGSNGFYALSALNPNGTSYQFNSGHEMIINIVPQSGEAQSSEIYFDNNTFSPPDSVSYTTSPFNVYTLFFYNFGYYPVTGYFGIAIYDQKTGQLSETIGKSSSTSTLNIQQMHDDGYLYYSGSGNYVNNCKISTSPPGNYFIKPVFITATDTISVHLPSGTAPRAFTVKGVTLDNTTLNMLVGDQIQLNPSIFIASPTTVTWSSDKPDIASVGVSNGLVTAVSKGSATIEVTVVDGTSTYTATCTVTVNDRNVTWLGNSTNWTDPSNWDAGRIPTASDIVYIPGVAPNFPDLQSGDNATAAEIHFQPGAQIGHQSYLSATTKAFVQYDFSNQLTQRDRWLMLSIPLGQVYTGDFSFGGYPATYMKSFSSVTNGTTTSGSWDAVTHSNEEPYSFGDAFVLWLNDDNKEPQNPDKGLKLLNGIREFPFYQHHAEDAPAAEREFYANVDQSHTYSNSSKESTFYGFMLSGADYIPDDSKATTVPRDDNSAYQLAKTGTNFTSIQADFTGGVFALIGNPYMATLDFGAFQQANTGIKKNYYIWTGAGYTIFTPDGNVGPTSATVVTSAEQFIPPLQGFLVEKQEPTLLSARFRTASIPPGGGDSGDSGDDTGTSSIPLSFNEGMTTVAQNVALRSSANVENKLNIIAGTPLAGFNAFIAKREGGQDEYGDLDARLISNGITDVPQIYTLKPNNGGLIAVGANIISSDDLLIPVGLATSYAGNITLSFSGMNNYDANLSFIDTEANKEIDLTGLTSCDYVVNYTPKTVNNAVAASENRFFIRISKTITGLDRPTVEKANVFEENGHIQVVSGASNPIKEVAVYSQQGALIYKNSAVNAISYSVSRNLPAGAYIVKVISEKNADNVKVIVK